MPALAKLMRPRLHQVVPRQRLHDRLDACSAQPLIWVSGPPGAGKTALVASWVEARRKGALWYQLDTGDRELGTCFHYLGLAAADAPRRRSAPLPALQPELRSDLRGFAHLYFRALFARLKAPATLVFDNWHELTADSGLNELLEPLVREVPAGAVVVVISRNDPPAACATLRAQDQLALLEWDELKLTLEEARQIAARRHTFDDESVRVAYEQSGGWPVGLTLTLEHLRRADAGSAGRRDSRELLFDYFAGQIFASQPLATRELLMRVALLPRASVRMAAELTGQEQAGAVLDGLWKRRLFVDRRGEAYQFHDLFRAFLLQQFEAAHDDGERLRWRRAAIALLQRTGAVEDAHALAATAQDWDSVTQLVLAAAPMLFEQGRTSTLRDWLAKLPPEQVEAVPWLPLWLGVSLSMARPRQAREQFAAAFQRFAAGSEDLPRLLCCGGVLMTHYLEAGDFSAMEPWIDELQALLARGVMLPAPAARLRVNSALLLALSLARPDPAQMAPVIARLQALLDPLACPVNARIDAAALLLRHHVDALDFDAAAQLVACVQPWLADGELSPFYRALWLAHFARYTARQGARADAAAVFADALELLRTNALSVPVVEILCHAGLAELALLDGDLAAAESARAAIAVRQHAQLDAGLAALLAAHRGDLAEALRQARRQFELTTGGGLVPVRFRATLLLALASIDAGHQDVSELLDQARALVHGSAYAALGCQVDLVTALQAIERGDTAAADGALRLGLAGSRADPGKHELHLWPRVWTRLLAHALRQDIDSDHARRLVRQLDLQPPAEEVSGWPWPLEIRTLGRFELCRDGRPLEFPRKVPKKTLALLKGIIALGGGKVSEQKLIDAFWADEEGDAAANALDASVTRLRVLLGDAAALLRQGGQLALNRERVWVDAFAFERALAASDGLQRALELYRGAFLAEDEGEAWPVAMRERLRGRYIHALVGACRQREQDGDFDGAIAVCQRGIDADPVVEAFYQGLMRAYVKLGRPTEAIAAFRRLRQVLSVTLGIAPSAESERLFAGLRGQ